MRAIHVPEKMMEAYDYENNPATFSRGIKVRVRDLDKWVFISGTASIGTDGKTQHIGNFVKQTKLMFDNVTQVLSQANVTWHDVVKTTIYIKNIAKHYKDFNRVRKDFYDTLQLKPYPASTCVQAALCRKDLLIEMEAIAFKHGL